MLSLGLIEKNMELSHIYLAVKSYKSIHVLHIQILCKRCHVTKNAAVCCIFACDVQQVRDCTNFAFFVQCAFTYDLSTNVYSS